MDDETMRSIDWYGEEQRIKLALDFWEGPRKRGMKIYQELDNTDRMKGRYIEKKLKELREAGGGKIYERQA